MALDAETLAALIQTKIEEKNPDSVGAVRSSLVDAIAEAIVEHITAKAEVRIPVVGLDLGATLLASWGARFTERGDATAPGALVPDTGLQSEVNVAGTPPTIPTTPPLASTMISTPGFID
jgi:hypothetical protein